MSILKQIKSILQNTKAPETAPEPVAPPPEPIERRKRKRSSHKGRKILVVDDSNTIVVSLSKMLESAGCIVSKAFDGESALEQVQASPPDLIFLDIVLPGMNGFAALRLLRKDSAFAYIPVIMMSGNEQATEQFYAKRIGADDFMKKPFSRFEVFVRMEQLLEKGILMPPGSSNTRNTRPSSSTQTKVSNELKPAATKKDSATNQPLNVAATAEHAKHLSIQAIANMSAVEARSQLTAMGLEYFNQEHFNAAVARKDQLAIDLFIIGGGIEIKQ